MDQVQGIRETIWHAASTFDGAFATDFTSPGSDIIHFEVFGRHIVVVNSVKAAKEIFEKHSAVSSDR